MTEQQVARSSIPPSAPKKEGQPHGQAQPTMPGWDSPTWSRENPAKKKPVLEI